MLVLCATLNIAGKSLPSFHLFSPYLFLSLQFFPKAGCVATTLEVTSHQALKSLFPIFFSFYSKERNHGENVGATALMVGRICSPSWNRVKVSETLGATVVVPVAPVDTSLLLI